MFDLSGSYHFINKIVNIHLFGYVLVAFLLKIFFIRYKKGKIVQKLFLTNTTPLILISE